MLAIPKYRKAYVDYLEELLDSNFDCSNPRPETFDFLSFYTRIRELTTGSPPWGWGFGPASLAEDLGVATYFQTTWTKTLADIA